MLVGRMGAGRSRVVEREERRADFYISLASGMIIWLREKGDGCMKPYEELTERGQSRRLRQLAKRGLAEYDVQVQEMRLEHHGHNTTYRIDNESGRYVLRISRPDWRTREQIRSEATWLAAIRRDTDLVVPKPERNADGDLVTTAGAEGVPEVRHCVLFRWVGGQRYRERLSPVAMERVGRFTAKLHNHVVDVFEPPPDFDRPSVQWGTEEKPGDIWSVMEEGMERGASIIAPADLATYTLARHHLQVAMQALDRDPTVYNLIHADLHLNNCLFHKGKVHAIDFDDCGWGHFLYDLAVTQWYFQGRPEYEELCAAHLDGYREVRPLSEEEETLLPLFSAARTLMIGMYYAARVDRPRLREEAPQVVARCAAMLRDYLGPRAV